MNNLNKSLLSWFQIFSYSFGHCLVFLVCEPTKLQKIKETMLSNIAMKLAVEIIIQTSLLKNAVQMCLWNRCIQKRTWQICHRCLSYIHLMTISNWSLIVLVSRCTTFSQPLPRVCGSIRWHVHPLCAPKLAWSVIKRRRRTELRSRSGLEPFDVSTWLSTGGLSEMQLRLYLILEVQSDLINLQKVLQFTLFSWGDF